MPFAFSLHKLSRLLRSKMVICDLQKLRDAQFLATLRQILFIGLEDSIHFGKKLSQYESDEKGVTVTFEDGTQATADLLVGADGIRSKVRKQRVPHAVIQDTGSYSSSSESGLLIQNSR